MGSGAALLWPAFDALKHQHEAKRDGGFTGIDGSSCRLVKLRCDVAPSRLAPVLLRQMPPKLAHVRASVLSAITEGMTSGFDSGRDQSGRGRASAPNRGRERYDIARPRAAAGAGSPGAAPRTSRRRALNGLSLCASGGPTEHNILTEGAPV